jgi:acyl-coenzyme A synthetase/AMP-(fatty) acid ligase
VSWSNAGRLAYHGRLDRQIKLYGYRIELDEIERAACDKLGLRECAVVVSTLGGRGRALAAFYAADQELQVAAIVAALKSRLPEYMIPREWRRLPELPRSVAGKLDRKCLESRLAGLGAVVPSPPSPRERAEPVVVGAPDRY